MWTAALGMAGYAVGGNWRSTADDFHSPTYAIAAIIALLGTGGLTALARKRRSEQAAATLVRDGSEPQPAGRPRGQHARR